ncbi:hypothetical protein BBG19_0057 [Francisella sp. MA067296]|nr:hypothetical protein BBG19_0057 [Francisella sp. MA067296]
MKYHNDKITSFLRDLDFTSLELWKYAKPLVRKYNTEQDVLCLGHY